MALSEAALDALSTTDRTRLRMLTTISEAFRVLTTELSDDEKAALARKDLTAEEFESRAIGWMLGDVPLVVAAREARRFLAAYEDMREVSQD